MDYIDFIDSNFFADEDELQSLISNYSKDELIELVIAYSIKTRDLHADMIGYKSMFDEMLKVESKLRQTAPIKRDTGYIPKAETVTLLDISAKAVAIYIYSLIVAFLIALAFILN